jgi:hypothetical protein
MKTQQLRFGKGFHVALSNARARVATMTIAPGTPKAVRQIVIVLLISGCT